MLERKKGLNLDPIDIFAFIHVAYEKIPYLFAGSDDQE